MSQTMPLTVANCPHKTLAVTNRIYISEANLAIFTETQEVKEEVYLTLGDFVFTAKSDKGVQPNEIGLNSVQRKRLAVSTGETITASIYNLPNNSALENICIEIDHVVKKKQGDSKYTPRSFVHHFDTPHHLSIAELWL